MSAVPSRALTGEASLPPTQLAMLRLAAVLWSGSLEVTLVTHELPENAPLRGPWRVACRISEP